MESWNTFTSNDLLYTVLGAAGLGSVVLVLRTALGNVNKRENILRRARQVQQELEALEKEVAAEVEES